MIFNVGNIENIKREIEKDHGISLPDVDVRYSDNIDHAFYVERVRVSNRCFEREKKGFFQRRTCELRRTGLKECEASQVDASKYTIFIPREYLNYPVRLYAAEWEELGHVAADALDVNDSTLNESIALAYRFKGLLKGVKDGFLQKEQAIHEIESYLERTKYEPLYAGLLSKLKEMGLKVPEEDTTPRHHNALSPLEKFNPNLNFRIFDLDQLLRMLDQSIEYTIKVSQYGFVEDQEETENPLIKIMKKLFPRTFRASTKRARCLLRARFSAPKNPLETFW